MGVSIKAIVFDYGGVIGVNFDVQDFHQKIPALAKFDDFRELILSVRDSWEKAKVGGDTQPFWDELSNLSGLRPAEIRRHFIEASQPNLRLMNLVERLRENYKVGILSNQIIDWLGSITESHALDKKFDLIMTSYEEQLAKPDPKIYLKMLSTLRINPTELIFVDDLSRNIKVAKEIGIHGLLYTQYSKLEQDLRALNIKF